MHEQLTRMPTSSISDHRSAVSDGLEVRVDTKPVLWRAQGSQTYVSITPVYQIGGNAIMNMVDAAALYVYSYVSNLGDGPISGGHFSWEGDQGLVLNAWSANNHQTTYGVLGAAIKALTSYFNAHGYGRVTFLIFDGKNQVGEGIVG